MTTRITRAIAGALVLAQVAGCGLILYPEREGQAKSGRIDPTVAILDGVGCLLFLIPGLIAFAVDFHEGTIYLPPGEATTATGWQRAALPAGAHDAAAIERAVRERTGTALSLADPRLQVYRVDHPEALALAGSP